MEQPIKNVIMPVAAVNATGTPYPIEQEHKVVAALVALGQNSLADRLRRCWAAGRGRSRSGGWPWMCGSLACRQCGRPVLRRWWAALLVWIGDHAASAKDTTRATTIFLPVLASAGAQVAEAVRRLRRILRDFRDRLARRDARWSSVAFAALLAGPRPVVMAAHPDLPHHVVAAALTRRWPTGIAREGLPDADAPDLHSNPALAAAVAALRRGVEPLRVVVPPQRRSQLRAPSAGRSNPPDDPWAEPMPVCV